MRQVQGFQGISTQRLPLEEELNYQRLLEVMVEVKRLEDKQREIEKVNES
jgi:hypothetical protein